MVKISGGYAKIKKWVTDRLHTDHQVASTESASFKEVNIAVNEAYKQGADIILRIKAKNTFIGIDAGKVTTGDRNIFIGYKTGESNIGGSYNACIGYMAGMDNTTGHSNVFIGYRAGLYNIGGGFNAFLGYKTGESNSSGYKNTFLGGLAGHLNDTGYLNAFIGYKAGYSNIGGSYNACIGHEAGYYETGSNKLFIDNIKRGNEADGRVKTLIYGEFAAATANQLVRLNAILELTSIKNGATQANAGASANEIWKTNGHATLPDNVLIIGV